MVFGDPHWIGFDQEKLRKVDNILRLHDEIAWAVKSQSIKIQVKSRTKNGNTQGIAVSGSFIGNHKLEIVRNVDQRHDFVATVMWDNTEILRNQGDRFQTTVAGTSLLQTQGGQETTAGASYVDCEHLQFAMPAPEDYKKLGWAKEVDKRFKQPGQFRCRLPNAVVIYVAKYDWMSIVIKMQEAPGGQDGLCGNFDGKDNDKWADVVRRMGGEHKVVVPKQSPQNLFTHANALLDVSSDDETQAEDMHVDYCNQTEAGLAFKEAVVQKCKPLQDEVFHTACIEDCCHTGDLGFESDEEEEEVLESMAAHNS